MKIHTAKKTPNASAQDTRPPSFWRSHAGVYLIAALVLGGLVLGYEYRARIFAGNWGLWLPLLICVGMHFFMHGGHRGHKGHGSRDDKE